MTKPFSLWDAAINGSSDDGEDGAELDDGVVGAAALVLPPELEQAARQIAAAAATRDETLRRIFSYFRSGPVWAVGKLLSAIAVAMVCMGGLVGHYI
jgi:hypothetical protein